MGFWSAFPRNFWQLSPIGLAFLVELLAAAHDEIRDHDEKTNSRDGPDNRNVVHGGLLSEAFACKVLRLKRNMS
jgi:hypothetical protein